MEPEFLDPGPDQPAPAYPPRPGPPWLPAPGAPGGPAPGRRPASPGHREVIGLLVMLLAAAALPLAAAGQTVYSVVEQAVGARESFAVSAWGDYHVTTGEALAGHAPRFGILLVLTAAAFALLGLLAAVQLLPGRRARPPAARTALGIAAAATGLVGLQVGITAAMTLQVQSAFAGFQEASGVLEVRLRVGPALWLALVGVIAGALAVLAALRVRRAFQEAISGY